MWDIIEGIGYVLEIATEIAHPSRSTTKPGPQAAFWFGILFVAIAGVWFVVTRHVNPHLPRADGMFLIYLLQATMATVGVLLVWQSVRMRRKG